MVHQLVEKEWIPRKLQEELRLLAEIWLPKGRRDSHL